MIKLGLILTALILIGTSSTHGDGEFSQKFVEGLQISSWFMYLSASSEYESGHNFVFSPMSIHQVLGMLYYGAAGETEKEILKNGLQMDEADDILPQFELLKTYFFEGKSGVTYPTKLANKAYISDTYKINQQYTDVVQGLFASDTESFNLQQTSKRISSNINKWVSEKTLGKITNLVDKSDITPYTTMILVNALYFKAKWTNEFSQSKKKIEWLYDNDEEEIIPGIETNDIFYYYDDVDTGMIYIAVPFDTDKIISHFVLAIPSRRYPKALKEFGNNVMPMMLVNIMPELKHYNEPNYIGKWRKSRKGIDVLRIPEFHIKSEFDLEKMMGAMKVDKMFNPTADFSKMAGAPGDIYISSFKHSAMVEVTKTGVEAAAATSAVAGTRMMGMETEMGKEIVADLPFFHGIYQDDFFIFMGNCHDPIIKTT